MLDLSHCTLLFVETRAHEITKRVIDDCLNKAAFGDVLIYSDKPELIPVGGARYITCADFPDKREAGRFYYAEAMKSVETDFALMLEWDAGIFDPAKWRDEFFNYDYIGAPWVRPAGDPQNVGNGGFTLMSKKLGHFAADNYRKFPVHTDWEFCRLHRRNYEAAGFKWPERDLASAFAWELGPRNPEHFGFHGAFTWPTLLSKDEIVARAHIMLKSQYLTVKARQLFSKAPWLMQELSSEELTNFHTNVPPGYQLQPTRASMQQRALMAGMRYRGLIPSSPQSGSKA